MQNIGMATQNEQGEVKEWHDVSFGQVWYAAETVPSLIWLNTIDPYGRTVFNKYQMPYVILELKQLREKYPELNNIPKIIEIFERTEKMNHHYLAFYGD